jgi:undecaprenyl-diphosphatase
MTWWQGVVLGVVQGFTEFLPISSSGHLVVAESVIGLRTPGVLVEVVLHVATLLAVAIVYWRRLVDLAVGVVTRRADAWRYVGLLAVGTIPAALIGFFFADWFERAFDSLTIVGVNFLLTAAILWSTRWSSRPAVKSEPTVSGATGIGFAQALAILPGISRSGSTIAAGLWLGLDPVRAAEYSFLLAIPAIVGAADLQIPDLTTVSVDVGVGPLAVGFITSLVAGIVAIRVLVVLLEKRAFHRFAPYCLILGLLTVTWALVK